MPPQAALLQAMIVSLVNVVFVWTTHIVAARQLNIGLCAYMARLLRLATGGFPSIVMRLSKDDPKLSEVNLSGQGIDDAQVQVHGAASVAPARGWTSSLRPSFARVDHG